MEQRSGTEKLGAMNMTPIKCRLDIDISPLLVVIPYLCCKLQTRGPNADLCQLTLGSLLKQADYFSIEVIDGMTYQILTS